MVNVRAGFESGQMIAGKYRVERVLGAGGMGIVLAATHLALDQRVAIKVMLGAGKPAAVRRFVREARVTVRLKNPHVARIFDIAALDDGTPYIVMEYLEGKDLSELLREHGSLPVSAAIDAVLQAAEALAEAHAMGIVHRDLKPANLFLVRNPGDSACIKVLDFGIAKWTRSGTEQLELSGVIGSVPYMAPEQITAPEQIDARTDVWALGATLFQLLTGMTPFQHDSVATPHSMIHAIVHRRPLVARSLRPALAPEMEAVLLRCLEKSPAARFQSMTALSEALLKFSSSVRLPAWDAPVPAAPATPRRPWPPRGLVIGAAATFLAGFAMAAATGWLFGAPAVSEPSGPSATTAAVPEPVTTAPAPTPDPNRSEAHAAPAAAADPKAPTAPDASAARRTNPPARAVTARPSPHIPPPARSASSAPAPLEPAPAPAPATRPQELYVERR